MPTSLHKMLEEDKPTEWTKFEIKEHMTARGKFNSRQIEYILNTQPTLITLPTTTTPAV